MNALICDRASAIQKQMTGREIGLFQTKMNQNIADAAILAGEDAKADDPNAPVYLVPADTGTGKSTFVRSLVIALSRSDLTYSAAVVIPTVQLAQREYDILAEYLGEDRVHLHTQVHSKPVTASIREQHGDEVADHIEKHGPSRADQLKHAPIIVCTHERWTQESVRQEDLGIRRYNGSYRRNVFVDEMPDTVSTISVTPSRVLFAIEQVERLLDSGEAVRLLRVVLQRMETIWAGKQTRLEACSLITPSELKGIENVDLTKLTDTTSLKCVQEVYAFLKRSLQGFSMIVRGHSAGQQVDGKGPKKAFISYGNDFCPHPGLIILDATAKLSPLARSNRKVETVETPMVDYRHLATTRFHLPEQFKSIASGSSSSLDEAFLRWVKHVVSKNSDAGDEVLVVLHKRQVELWGGQDTRLQLRNRTVHLAYWGNGVGSNQWRDCKTVFLFSEFHNPAHTHVTEALAWRNDAACTAKLRAANGQGLSGDFKTARDEHRLRHFKQMACRGTVRKIDGNGIAAPMRLFTCMDRNLFQLGFSELFPGAPDPTYIEDDQPKPKTKPQKVADFLTREKRRVVDCDEIASALGMKVKEVGRAFEGQACQGLRYQGWRLSKGDGKRSKPVLKYSPPQIPTELLKKIAA